MQSVLETLAMAPDVGAVGAAHYDRIGTWVNEGGAGGEVVRKPLRILVVEDDALIGALLGELLVEMGHQVCAIEVDEAGAVAAAARHKPDLMIVDATLGEGNGIRAVDTVNLSGSIRHLFTSGDTLRVKLLRPDAIVVQKPFVEIELARAITRAMGAPTIGTNGNAKPL